MGSISREGAKRVEKQTIRSEREIQGGEIPARGQYPRRGGGGWPKVGLTSSTITARSGSTLGSGTVGLQKLSGSGPVTQSGLSSKTCYNPFLHSIGSGIEVVVAKIDGVPVIIAADCP